MNLRTLLELKVGTLGPTLFVKFDKRSLKVCQGSFVAKHRFHSESTFVSQAQAWHCHPCQAYAVTPAGGLRCRGGYRRAGGRFGFKGSSVMGISGFLSSGGNAAGQ
eukprot:EG_transcript_53445